MEPQTESQEPKPKHTRRSRRSLVWRIDECHLLIDRELAAGNERPARLTLLKAKLDSLMELLKREDRKKEATPGPAKAEETTSAATQTISQPDPLDDIVAGMLKRHANQKTPATMMPSTPAALRPVPAAPVTSDDLLV